MQRCGKTMTSFSQTLLYTAVCSALAVPVVGAQTESTASVQQLKEGINIPKLKASIILHTFASEYVTKQKIGRLLRLPVNELAVVHILMYKDTIDETWVKKALQDYNPEKIIYL